MPLRCRDLLARLLMPPSFFVSVLPPPPRYPAQVAYAAAAANGYYVPGLETTNEVTTDEKGDWTLQAGEGMSLLMRADPFPAPAPL